MSEGEPSALPPEACVDPVQYEKVKEAMRVCVRAVCCACAGGSTVDARAAAQALLAHGSAKVDEAISGTRQSLVSRLASLQTLFMMESDVSPTRNALLHEQLRAHHGLAESLVLEELTAGLQASTAVMNALSAAVAAREDGDMRRIAAEHGEHVRGLHERATRALITSRGTLDGRVDARTALDRAVCAGREAQLRDAHALALVACRAEGAVALEAAAAACEQLRVQGQVTARQLTSMNASMTELGRVIGSAMADLDSEEGSPFNAFTPPSERSSGGRRAQSDTAPTGDGYSPLGVLTGSQVAAQRKSGHSSTAAAAKRHASKSAKDPRAWVESIAKRLQQMDKIERESKAASERALASHSTIADLEVKLGISGEEVMLAETDRDVAVARVAAIGLERDVMAVEMRKAKEAAARAEAATRKGQAEIEAISSQRASARRARAVTTATTHYPHRAPRLRDALASRGLTSRATAVADVEQVRVTMHELKVRDGSRTEQMISLTEQLATAIAARADALSAVAAATSLSTAAPLPASSPMVFLPASSLAASARQAAALATYAPELAAAVGSAKSQTADATARAEGAEARAEGAEARVAAAEARAKAAEARAAETERWAAGVNVRTGIVRGSVGSVDESVTASIEAATAALAAVKHDGALTARELAVARESLLAVTVSARARGHTCRPTQSPRRHSSLLEGRKKC